MTSSPGTLDYACPMPRRPRFARGLFGWVLFIGLAIMLIALFQMKSKNYSPITFSQFTTELKTSNIGSVTLSENELVGEFLSPRTFGNAGTTGSIRFYRCTIPPGLWNNVTFVDRLTSSRASVAFDDNQNILINLLVPFIPWLLIFGFIWFFVFRQLRFAAANRAVPVAQPVPPAQQGQA